MSQFQLSTRQLLKERLLLIDINCVVTKDMWVKSKFVKKNY